MNCLSRIRVRGKGSGKVLSCLQSSPETLRQMAPTLAEGVTIEKNRVENGSPSSLRR